MSESTVTSRGQTTLPARVRTALALEPGDRVRYVILDGGEVRLMRARPAAGLAGMLARPGQKAVSVARMDEAIAAAAQDDG